MGKVSKKVIAIVVTYNRKELLKECINALLNQEYKNCEVLIVDNYSTDGTKEFIADELKNKKVHYVNTGANLGGAGGFNYGMKEAYKIGCDFMWLMDDDCIVHNDSLTKLMEADERLNGNYGFLSSKVFWNGNVPCKMNKQKVSSDWYDYSAHMDKGILKIEHSTFVSFLIKKEVIERKGLPIKEFFIWGDDIEYSERISKDYPCYVVGTSIVDHKIKNNEGSNIALDDISRINRYKYAYRNEMFTARVSGFKKYIRQNCKIVFNIFKVIKYSKEKKMKRIATIINGSFKGLFFNPKIEYLGKN